MENELTDAHLGTLQDGIVDGPYPEGDPWVVTFRDPAGNVLGIGTPGNAEDSPAPNDGGSADATGLWRGGVSSLGSDGHE